MECKAVHKRFQANSFMVIKKPQKNIILCKKFSASVLIVLAMRTLGPTRTQHFHFLSQKYSTPTGPEPTALVR